MPRASTLDKHTQVGIAPTTDHGANYTITVFQTPDRSDPTTLWLSKVDNAGTSTLRPTTWNVDQEADYYLAPAGAVASAQTIASAQFSPLFTLDHPYSLNVPLNSDFYLAIATTYRGPGFERDVWGWVHLKNTASGLTQLGSAMAYDEGGIVVGTMTAVPEPGTFAQLGMGLVALALYRRAQGRQTLSAIS